MNQESSIHKGNPVRKPVTIVEDRQQTHSDLAQIFARYVTDVHVRLQSNPPARVADIGCGSGDSSINMALTYPRIRLDGYDIDVASIEKAWANARRAGVTDRVTFHVRDVGDGSLNGRYDLITAFVSIHAMANPIGVLMTIRRLVSRKGIIINMAEHPEIGKLESDAKEAGFSTVDILPIEVTNLPALVSVRLYPSVRH